MKKGARVERRKIERTYTQPLTVQTVNVRLEAWPPCIYATWVRFIDLLHLYSATCTHRSNCTVIRSYNSTGNKLKSSSLIPILMVKNQIRVYTGAGEMLGLCKINVSSSKDPQRNTHLLVNTRERTMRGQDLWGASGAPI